MSCCQKVPPAVELHLRVRVKQGRRADFFKFLDEAVPYYAAPGNIGFRLLEYEGDDHSFLEVVEYGTEEAYDADQSRVATDDRMKELLARWRELLAEKPEVETYRLVAPEVTVSHGCCGGGEAHGGES